MYFDECYNQIYQDSQWNDSDNQNDDNDDENEDDDEDNLGIDGWERIDDETFVLTKPSKFERKIKLTPQSKEDKSETEEILTSFGNLNELNQPKIENEDPMQQQLKEVVKETTMQKRRYKQVEIVKKSLHS